MHFIETLLKEPPPPDSGIRRGFWGAPSPEVYILVDVSSTPVLTQSRAHKATAMHSGQRAEWHSHPGTSLPGWTYRRSLAFRGLSSSWKQRTQHQAPASCLLQPACFISSFPLELESNLHSHWSYNPISFFFLPQVLILFSPNLQALFWASPNLLSFTPFATLIASFSVKLTSN